LVELFLLVSDVATFAGLSDPVALDGAGEDHGRRSLVLDGGLVRRIDLCRVVTSQAEAAELLVRHIGDHCGKLGVFTEEVLADIGAGGGGVLLAVTVHRLAHPTHQETVRILGKQRVPIFSPDHLDDIPTRAPEVSLELLNDLAVTADRAVETLQIAVDDKDQIVEVLPSCK